MTLLQSPMEKELVRLVVRPSTQTQEYKYNKSGLFKENIPVNPHY
jgi:hypothetical protein